MQKSIQTNLTVLQKGSLLKEAFSKALGTGISRGISFNEIVVLNEKMENHL